MRYDALIIGGGPAGATTALLLARAGWSVAVVEKKAFPRRKVCGEFISATSLPLLDMLGIGNVFRENAGPEVRRVGLFARDMWLTADMPRPTHSSGHWGRALGREQLDLLLLEAAHRAGCDVWQPWTAVEFQHIAGGYTCVIAAKDRSRILEARILILAHGSWERSPWTEVRKPHSPSDLLAFKAHFRDCELPVDLMPLLVFPGGYGGMVHSDNGRVSLSCCIRRDQLQHCRRLHPAPSAGAAILYHIETSCRAVREILKRARPDGTWLSAGPINPGIRRRYANGLFFVGNIAGEAHPIVAEGISMAMQSAWLLARLLISRQDEALSERTLAEIGTRYARNWNACFAPRLRAAAAFAHLTMRPGITTLYLPLLKRFPGILTLSARLSGKAAQMAFAG